MPYPDDLPELPPEELRGHVFQRWQEIPKDGERGAILRTKSQWYREGYELIRPVEQFASISYVAPWGHARTDPLYAADQLEPRYTWKKRFGPKTEV